jgi:hypothetical protein
MPKIYINLPQILAKVRGSVFEWEFGFIPV